MHTSNPRYKLVPSALALALVWETVLVSPDFYGEYSRLFSARTKRAVEIEPTRF